MAEPTVINTAPPVDTRDDTPIFSGGVYRPEVKQELTGRQNPVLGVMRDAVIDLAVSSLDVLGTPYTAARDLSTPGSRADQAAQLGQRTIGALKDTARGWKTEYGQQEDENAGKHSTFLERAGSTVISAAPAIATALATGPLAPATFGGLYYGSSGQALEERLSKIPQEQLLKLPSYQQHIQQGMSHEQALGQMYRDGRETWEEYIATLANVATGGITSKIAGKLTSRSVAETMTQRIMLEARRDLPEAVLGGYATGFAQSGARQRGEMETGERERYSLGEMHEEGAEMGTMLGAIAGPGVVLRSVRGTKEPAAAPGPGNIITEPLNQAGEKAKAPDIGSELIPVAQEDLADKPKKGEEITPPSKPVTAVTDVTDLNAPVAPTAPTAPVEQQAPAPAVGAPPPPAGAVGEGRPFGTTPNGRKIWHWDGEDGQTRFASVNEFGNVINEGVVPGQRAATATPEVANATRPAPTEISQPTEVAPGPRPAEVAPPAAAAPTPTPAAAGVEAAPKFTRDQLMARAVNLELTPDHGALQRHIAEWQRENPGQKLSNRNDIVEAWKAAHNAARQEG